MITPDSPERSYSTRLRTAVVLTGSGTAGAYHAGILRALHEAGVRTDLVAGRGMGAAGAMFAAVDGSSRLWESSGIWKSSGARRFYAWRRPLRVAAWALLAAGAVLLFPLLLLAIAVIVGVAGFLVTLVGFAETGTALTGAYAVWLHRWFAPDSLPLVVPRLVLLGVLAAFGTLGVSLAVDAITRRRGTRVRGGLLWRLLGTPLSPAATVAAFSTQLWGLIRGAVPVQKPRGPELARRYVELLADNLGQPGFRELIVVVHDIDARQDLVAAFLAEAHRPRFLARLAGPAGTQRPTEVLDLGGVGRDHALDVLAASLALPLATPPHLVTFPREGPWRGETHRLCDRPASLPRLLEEVAAAGAEQVLLLSATPRAARPHEMDATRGDVAGSAGQQLAAFESAALRDVLEQFAGRFAGLYVIRPDHNPVGPFDFGGTYDERSSRTFSVAELVDRGYEDAYRQFIDPVVGASGDRIQSATTR